MPNLNNYIKLNSEFRSSVNLYLSLNKKDKIESFIPTKSSVDILKKYLGFVEENKVQATLLLGPYGKGKSHLLLVLMAVLSMERNSENQEIVLSLKNKICKVDRDASELIEKVWAEGRFLPVIISGAHDDLSTPFLIGISDALKRAGFEELTPNTYYSHAIENIIRWRENYPDTYNKLENTLKKNNISVDTFINRLKGYDEEALKMFRQYYSKFTSGGSFNPLVNEDILPVYRNISEQLKDKYGFSGIYIIFDEFSKFIEGQDKKSAGNNMKLLQDMCELANDSKGAKVYITMVAHKGIKEYGKYLSKDIINSFTGIEGRIEEIQFITSTKNNYELIQNAIIKNKEVFEEKHVKRYIESESTKKYFDIPAFKSTFNSNDFDNIVLKGCFPLSPISAYLLLNVSEKVAQNERTLFTFISKEEQGSMATYVNNHTESMPWVVQSDLIYDYFKLLFKKSITNEFVHNEWLNAEYALSQTNNQDEKKMIKTLALINIINKPSELSSNENILVLAYGNDNADDVIKGLESKGLIYKKETDNSYVFKTRATSDARNEITKRKAIRSNSVNYSKILEDVSKEKFVIPRKYNFEYQMTRYFSVDYMNVNEFLEIDNAESFVDDDNFSDGRIIKLYKFDNEDYSKRINEKIMTLKANKLIVIYSNSVCNVLESLKEYDAVNDLKNDTRFFSKEENRVLKGEIPLIENELTSLINTYINNAFSDAALPYIYRYTGNKTFVTKEKKLVDVVEDVTEKVYDKVIRINNELINKQYITTSPIKKVRTNIIKALLEEDVDTIERYKKGTSADSTIYRALFVNNGISTLEISGNEKYFIDTVDKFINECGNNRRKVSDLTQILESEPFGVRKGVIPIYLAYCISKCKEDVIVYFSEREIEITADTFVNMCDSPADYSLYISLDNEAKEEYLKNLAKLLNVSIDKNIKDSRITNIFAAMQRWFRALPQVTKNIKHQEKYFSNEELARAFVQIKNILQQAESNPYSALFVDIPKAFNVNNLIKTFEGFNKLHDKLGGYYYFLREDIIKNTKEIFDGNNEDKLRYILSEWHDRQSDSAKNGLYTNKINEFMKLCSTDKYIDDTTLAEKLSKIIVGVYCDSWNDSSINQYIDNLHDLKEEIESIDVEEKGRKETLTFTGKNGNTIVQKYDLIEEGKGVILKNIIYDAMDDFSDLPVNDKVAILLEMVEKTIGQEM